MRSFALFVPALLLLAPPATAGAESTTSLAQEHVRKACELVWMNAAEYEIQRCSERAMAALGEHDRLRDNELKRLILESEKELEACQAERDELRDELLTHETTVAKRNPRFPSRP